MSKEISTSLRSTFLIHWILAGILGLGLWIVPGRLLMLVGWIDEWVQLPDTEVSIPGGAFVNSGMMRLLGAALLALAFSSFRGWRAREWSAVAFLVQAEAVFFLFGTISLIYGIFSLERMPFFGWILLVILAVFTIAWLLALRRRDAASAS